jgi:hypothetical protein
MPADDRREATGRLATELSLDEFETLVIRFVDRAFAFSNRRCDPQDIHDAWRTFRVWQSAWIDYKSEDWRLFLAWYVFHWRVADEQNELPEAGPLAALYAAECPEEISPAEQKMLATAMGSPLDFYEIYELPEPNCFYLKSLFLGYQHSYAFTSLPPNLKTGDVFFGKIVHFRDDKGVIAAHSRPFPSTAKVAIAYIRRQLILGRKEEFIKNFSLFDSDLFNLYYDLLNGEEVLC